MEYLLRKATEIMVIYKQQHLFATICGYEYKMAEQQAD